MPSSLPFYTRLLLAATWLSNMGRFAAFTFLAVHLTQELQLSSWQTGTILSLSILLHEVFPLVFGFLGDRWGVRRLLAAGYLFSAAGYGIWAISSSFLPLMVGSIFIGMGGALYDPSLRASLSVLPLPARQRAFTYLNQALNGGALLGAGIGGGLVLLSPVLPFVLASMAFILLVAVIRWYGRHLPTPRFSAGMTDSIVHVFYHFQFLLFCLWMTIFWMMNVQLTLSFPLRIHQMTGTAAWASTVVILNGSLAFLSMFFLRKWFHRFPPHRFIGIGMGIVAISFAWVPWLPGVSGLLFCVALFTIGETMVLPASDLAVADFGGGRDPGAFFGVYSLSFALGGTIGNFWGTSWIAPAPDTPHPWLWIGFLGLLAGAAVAWSTPSAQTNEHPRHTGAARG